MERGIYQLHVTQIIMHCPPARAHHLPYSPGVIREEVEIIDWLSRHSLNLILHRDTIPKLWNQLLLPFETCILGPSSRLLVLYEVCVPCFLWYPIDMIF